MAFRITAINTTTGYLQATPIEFSPGFNCIIGARGTCKSTVVETLRFLFNKDEERIAALVEEKPSVRGSAFSGLLAATLRNGTARCLVSGDDHELLSLEREIGAPRPRVYKDKVRELVDVDFSHRVEIYSQSDLQLIAADPEKQIGLIDRANAAIVKINRVELENHGRRLRILGEEIRTLREKLEGLNSEVKILPELREALKKNEAEHPQIPKEMAAERSLHDTRQDLLNQAALGQKLVLDLHDRFVTQPHELLRLEGIARATEKSDLGTIARMGKNFRAVLTQIQAWQQLLGEWKNYSEGALHIEALREFEVQSASYFQLRQKMEEHNAALKQQEVIAKQIRFLEERTIELTNTQSEIAAKLAERDALRAAVAATKNKVYQLRAGEVKRINSQFAQTVLLTLRPGGRASKYQILIEDLLSNSRMRNKADLAGQIVTAADPGDFIALIESGDIVQISEKLNLDPGVVTRLHSHLVQHPNLYSLESVLFEDELEIQLYVDGAPKRVEELSKGQRATALLPLILTESADPLIFDQPEDDLDNRFIYDTLVKTIQNLKSKRQLIFVTHNANIPVLGDADLIIVMSMRRHDEAAPARIGTVDERREDIISLLEGGREAFDLRRKKYNK